MTVANEEWFRGLSDKHQAAVFDASKAACRTERQTAIGEEAAMSKICADQGLTIVRMDEDRHAELRQAAMGMYDEFVPRFGEELVGGIQSI